MSQKMEPNFKIIILFMKKVTRKYTMSSKKLFVVFTTFYLDLFTKITF